jgi:hypothetical protein
MNRQHNLCIMLHIAQGKSGTCWPDSLAREVEPNQPIFQISRAENGNL